MNYEPTQMPATPGSRVGPVTAASLLLLVVLAVYGAFNLVGLLWSPLHDPAARPAIVQVRGELGPAEQSTIEIFRRCSPSVVHVTTSTVGRGSSFRNPLVIPRGTGSGFTWGDEGHVVTNFHVVAEGTRWEVTLADMSTHEARLVGYMARYDLAVLKIETPARRLKPAQVGSSRELLVGQSVFAIGNPFGLDQTLTTGVISGLGRRIRGYSGEIIEDVIQIDAAINPGNSGGPLFDSAGLLIGVNTAIDSEGGEGIGFAVPVDTVNQVVPMIIRGGIAATEAVPGRAGLGVIIAPESFTQLQGVEGVMIERVLPGSAAEQAGLRSMSVRSDGRYVVDVIKRIGEQATRTNHDLLVALKGRAPGDRIPLTFEREGIERVVEITLESISER